jgi:predicted dehydrogenase/diketogulonate reductase-like aldo/keto reductase
MIRWGILAAGRIAGAFAKGVAHCDSGHVVAVASRSLDKAEAFAKEHGIERAHGSYEALLNDPEVDAVYIATPHPMHPQWCIAAARAGKHILCEKPLALNRFEAETAIEAARAHGVLMMEAFMYRCHPQTRKVVELVQSGAIGELRMMTGSFGFNASGVPKTHRLMANELGGGGILDVGGYPVSMARLIAGAASGKPFADPIDVTGFGHVGETGVDEWATATLRFDGDVVAQVSTSVVVTLANDFRIFGSTGSIHVPKPWVINPEGGMCEIVVNGETQTIETDRWLYGIEADAAAEAINAGKQEAAPPAMTWADTLGNMATLDRWRMAIGQQYEAEKWHNTSGSVQRPSEPKIPAESIAGIDKPISKLILGTDAACALPGSHALFDAFYELGGTCFDTAHIYSSGKSEEHLGWWLRSRGVRDDVVVIAKGAHSPNCFPEHIEPQLDESLERLRTNHADLYFLHRDNPDVPVGEFADALDKLVRAGRIHAIGGSNWSPSRVDAFNAYAAANGLTPMGAVSNNFSLARLIKPYWPGCITSSDDTTRTWHERRQMPLFAWSSQARGFFVEGLAAPDKLDDSLMVQAWYSDDNFERRRRAFELAQQRGVSGLNIALAYAMTQAFPLYALIGPRSLAELRTVLPALSVELSADETAWLDLRKTQETP